MKKIIFLLFSCIMLVSCNANADNKVAESSPASEISSKEYVEVLYFHGKQRCATCMAIERNTKDVLQKTFSDEMKKGKVIFKVIDISKKENEKIAEKYEVTWSSLFVVKYKNGKETSENMTQFAFANARKSPDEFKSGVINTVNKMLK